MSNYFSAMFTRRQNDGWFRAGRYDATTVDIICAVSVATMFLWAFSRSLFSELVFFPEAVRDFDVWRVFTWPIATEPNLWELLGLVFFWVFGQQLEGLFGRNRFFGWIAAITVIPAVLVTVLDVVVDLSTVEFGLSTLFLCGIWVYAATYPGVRWFEVVPLWALAAVFTVLNLLQFSGARATGKIVFMLAAIGVALVAARSLGLATGWPIPHIPLAAAAGSSSGRSRAPRKQKRKRGGKSKGGVVEGPWQRGPAPTPPKPVPSPADQAELDSLLDKIGSHGMDSLTSAEKKRLNELSKRLRG